MKSQLPVLVRAPCHKPGKGDCEKRSVGCQSKCEIYLEYRRKLDEIRKKEDIERGVKQMISSSIFGDRRNSPRMKNSHHAVPQR